MKDLIERYEIKVNLLNACLRQAETEQERFRLKVKLGCYRSFLTDLKRLQEDLGKKD